MKYRLIVFAQNLTLSDLVDSGDAEEIKVSTINNFESSIELADIDLLEDKAQAILWRLGFPNNVTWGLYYRSAAGSYNYITGESNAV